MNKVLVVGSDCYADEFDVYFFGIFTKEKWDELCEKVKARFVKLEKNFTKRHEWDHVELEVGFGTNECLTISSYDDWFRCMTVKEISDDEAKFLMSSFDISNEDGEAATWGTASGAMLEYITGEEEDDEDADLEDVEPEDGDEDEDLNK